LLGELASKSDDVGHVGYPCLIEDFGGVSAFCHDLAPVGLEIIENTFDVAVGETKIFFVEFFEQSMMRCTPMLVTASCRSNSF
jgi:hypothetical protein